MMEYIVPGRGYDLDALVDTAIAKQTPDAVVDPECWKQDFGLLVAVCVHGRLDLADRLFAAGATITSKAFEEVFRWNLNAGMATYLIEHCSPFNKQCLSYCIWADDWNTFFVLFGNGKGVKEALPASEVTDILQDALWSASHGGATFAVRRLLLLGADANGNNEFTPLLSVCDWQSEGHKADAETAYWLLTNGANPNAQTAYGETPLLLCTGQKLPAHVHHRRTQTAQMLLRFGANPNAAVPKFETTALMFAARDDDAILARALLKAGADTEMKTPNGRTARDVAEQRGSKNVLALLS